MKIGIIGAMDMEVRGIFEKIENPVIEKISNITFYSGKISDKEVVVAKCGEGKVNSAMTAQTMIFKYAPDYVVNTGVAGGLHPGLGVLDVAVASDVCQHDFDITPLGYDIGYIPVADRVKIPCNENLICQLKNSAEKFSDNVVSGTVATGDKFVASKQTKDFIISSFNAVSAEMEGGSIGQVCYLNNIPFCVLRVISDNADGSADMSFETFAEKASNISVNIITDFLKNLRD